MSTAASRDGNNIFHRNLHLIFENKKNHMVPNRDRTADDALNQRLDSSKSHLFEQFLLDGFSYVYTNFRQTNGCPFL